MHCWRNADDLCDSLAEQQKAGDLARIKDLTTYNHSTKLELFVGPCGRDLVIEELQVAFIRQLPDTSVTNVSSVRRLPATDFWSGADETEFIVAVTVIGDGGVHLRLPNLAGLERASMKDNSAALQDRFRLSSRPTRVA